MPTTWPPKLRESLIPSPKSDEEHAQNLAVLMGGTDLVIEKEYRGAYPEIDHARFVRLVNLPEFWNRFYAEVRTQVGLSNYRRILDVHSRRALDGDIQSARFVLAELRLSEERREALQAVAQAAGQESFVDRMTEVMSRMLDKKPKVLDAKAEVK